MKDQVILLDGAMGSELRNRGCTVPSHLDSIWSAQVLLDDPETIFEVHRDYILAGADVITANNYAVTQDLLERVDLGHRLSQMTEQAMELALRAKKEAGGKTFVAGSLPPLNTSYRADLVNDHRGLVRKYSEILEVLVPKADLIIIESMASGAEAIGALEACEAVQGKEVWLSLTLHGNRRNTLPSGEDLSKVIDAVSGYRFEKMLINCCATNQLTGALRVIARKTGKPFGGYANPERVHTFGNSTGIDYDPEGSREGASSAIGVPEYLEDVKSWLNLGASVIGGCCRTTPEYIRKIRNHLDQ